MMILKYAFIIRTLICEEMGLSGVKKRTNPEIRIGFLKISFLLSYFVAAYTYAKYQTVVYFVSPVQTSV